MCGIWGRFVGESGSEPKSISNESISRALVQLGHRGPDGYGVYRAPRAALAQTRLAIIGLSNGAQPLQLEGRPWVGVVNGEIYNYIDLKKRLQALGCDFKTESDSEVLLQAYAQWGLAGLQSLEGEFAFILWNPKTQSAVFGRDRHGVKPLYWRLEPSSLELASEVKALRRPDDTLDFESWGTQMLRLPTPLKTLFSKIEHVPPGQVVSWKQNEVTFERYARLPLRQARVLERQDAEQSVGQSFQEAVEKRCLADVEVGCYLSGGLDSSLVAAAMVKAGHRPQLFTVGFPAGPFDESQRAAAVARALGCQHHIVQLNDENFIPHLERSFLAFEMPTGNSHGAAKNLLAAHASRHVKVVLSGEGADEYFGGYAYLRHQKLKRFVERHPRFASSNLETRFLEKEQGIGDGYLLGSESSWESLGQSFFGGFKPALLSRLVSPRLVRSLFGRNFYGYARAFEAYQKLMALDGFDGSWNDDDLNVWFSLRGDLLNYILANLGDRQEMSHSLEGRTPFLDSRLAELACQLKGREWLYGLKEKFVLRKLLPKSLKQPIRKQPFFAPHELLSSRKASEYCQDHMASLERWVPEFDFQKLRVLFRSMESDPARSRLKSEMTLYMASTHVLLSQLGRQIVSPQAHPWIPCEWKNGITHSVTAKSKEAVA